MIIGVAATMVACTDSVTSPSSTPSVGARGTHEPLPYAVVDLQTDLIAAGFDGAFSVAFDINDAGRVSGAATLPGGNQHGFLWTRNEVVDVGTLGGSSSQAAGRAGRAELAVLAETRDVDPLAEDFCIFHTGLLCRAAVWRHGELMALPTLGGNNAAAYEINGPGEIIGVAENGVLDPSCRPPLKSRFEAVMWRPETGTVRELPPLPGDQVGFALRNNDRGQVVGSTGLCSNTFPAGLATGPHAVLWEDGVPRNLGSLGGPDADVGVAADINDRGQVIGASGSSTGSIHPFLWTSATGMTDLGLLSADPADVANTPFEINERGQIVGASCDVTLVFCRAYLWQNGVMRDLNELVPPDSPLYLVLPFGIDDEGDIVGLGVSKSTGEPHAFLATPIHGGASDHVAHLAGVSTHAMALPDRARALLGRSVRPLQR
jgi:probable HAF family extracellular repeat protein